MQSLENQILQQKTIESHNIQFYQNENLTSRPCQAAPRNNPLSETVFKLNNAKGNETGLSPCSISPEPGAHLAGPGAPSRGLRPPGPLPPSNHCRTVGKIGLRSDHVCRLNDASRSVRAPGNALSACWNNSVHVDAFVVRTLGALIADCGFDVDVWVCCCRTGGLFRF